MNVSTEDIKSIPAGSFKLIPCEDGGKVKSARSLVSHVKETCMPDDVVDYDTKKIELESGLVFGIFAMGKGDTPIFSRLVK